MSSMMVVKAQKQVLVLGWALLLVVRLLAPIEHRWWPYWSLARVVLAVQAEPLLVVYPPPSLLRSIDVQYLWCDRNSTTIFLTTN